MPLLICVSLSLVSCSDTVNSISGPGPECEPQLASGCWTFLGLEDQTVMDLTETPSGLFAATESGGIFRLRPGGGRWESLGLEAFIVNALLFAPGPTPRLLAAVSPTAQEQRPPPVFASTDGGDTWIPWDGGLAERFPEVQLAGTTLAIDPGDPERLYMGGFGPRWRSIDGGRSWQFLNESAENAFAGPTTRMVVSPHRDGRVWAGGSTGFFAPIILRSEDWGDTWELSFPDRPGLRGDGVVLDVAADEIDPQRVWMSASAPGFGVGVFQSDDAGLTWELVLGDVSVFRVLRDSGVLYAVGDRDRRVSGSGLILSELSLFRSVDDGTTWNALEVPAEAAGANTAAFDLQGRLLIGTVQVKGLQEGGVWRFDPSSPGGAGS